MHLRCKVCLAVQPVTLADEADEDARTASIRRAFRAEHLASCGDGSVSLVFQSADATYVDPEIWNHYIASCRLPEDVNAGADGFFYRLVLRDGQQHNVRVCEDCWENIPRYVDFPAGLISPESGGDGGRVPKFKPGTVETDSPDRSTAVVHLWKAVCLPCYFAAFARIYPDAQWPDLRADVVGDGSPVTPAAPIPAESLGKVMISRIGRDETA